MRMVKVIDATPGQVFIGWGKGWQVERPARYQGSGDIGSEAERQRYVLPLVNVETNERRLLPANGESRITVLD